MIKRVLVIAVASVLALGGPALAANLIVNGDFEAGNTGFSSDYLFTTSNRNPAQYTVGTNPRAWNSNLRSFGDNTTGSTNMMIVNGSQSVGDVVWRQSVAVNPATSYDFSMFVRSAFSGSGDSQLRINGQTVGDPFLEDDVTDWLEIKRSWESGLSSIALIEIINLGTAFGGNDFAFDDISFLEGDTSAVPVPAAALLFVPLAAGVLLRSRKKL
ncbi:MAG: hypothetical protein HRU11_13355 [Parvularculaceae bacterium]|nr:hypothetical protein [Parvularculaceae bacterium]